MNKDQTIKYLPYHAINEFMTDEYRFEILSAIIETFETLPSEHQTSINQVTKKFVKIPGFRNSQKAPGSLKLREMGPVFKKNAIFVAKVLSAWSALHGTLKHNIAEFLTKRGWEILPAEADRSKLPGFLTVWPEGDSFESLTEEYRQLNPDTQAEDNDISLMIVWLSNRLPYETSSDLFPHIKKG